MTHTPDATPKVHPERQRRVKTALQLFSATAWITGVLLLLLVVRMVMQYLLNLDVSALDWVARVHGLAFIAFLMASLNLGTKARWSAVEWLTTALSGVVPLMSFFVEAKRRREVQRTFQLTG
ncbi:DUF3817 domain-containing protein [Corynebacterium sanguinis]|uniref:DUF3817 domain-containing protein n=1 Tax=Corynebacterium sanguinis TaxID=2594913 RepID=UPI00119F53B3|nr:DUF3817 domain-containing protein [Corynebacterium sanguinis]MCT1426064.1 DUF3817 domain-containing protein [Corynebacterium sanguinis]MCT1597206.1 DUF3817 domain-containing protein [Corynebacterium sanguinis]MCT1628724.1 DUF3817 domain-containing protein [Corynebacterium sanguinis]MCT1695816.1 DUF3817 domain-containing protein [Corynebacterium sanguinis]MCT1715233.1 DUF3817 domain-containing protein [Corynebacterium sanguinis]